MTAHDALFYTPWPLQVVLQQFHVVVSFQHQDVGGAYSFHHQLSGMPQIGQETNLATIGPQHKPYWVVSVMRDGECFDADFTDFEGGPGAEKAKIELNGLLGPVAFELKLDGFLGEAIAVNRHRDLIAERAKAVGVVGVFVREQDAAETFRSAADLREALANLLRAETGIDQEAGISVLEICAIAVGAAAKDRKLNRH